MMTERNDVQMKSHATLVAALVNIFLAVMKVSAGVLGQSSALIADGIHSLADLLSDAVVLVAIKLGSKRPDQDHPYGHARFETIATVVLGCGLIVVAAGISWDAVSRILGDGTLLIPDQLTLYIAGISIFCKEWLFHFTKKVAQKTRSKLLLANAWHHRSDAISSIIVLIGIAAMLLGYGYADAIAAVLVSLMIAKIGVSLIMESLKELVDTAISDDELDALRQAISVVDGVINIHLIRTRRMGEDIYVDLHIQVDSYISVSEGHMIADTVRNQLLVKFDNIVDVLVHTDPEDDEQKESVDDWLPSRKELINGIRDCLGDYYSLVDDIKIHYINGAVELEVIFLLSPLEHDLVVDNCKKHCEKITQEIASVREIRILFFR
jgi:cation diffusion facilitator family transporter